METQAVTTSLGSSRSPVVLWLWLPHPSEGDSTFRAAVKVKRFDSSMFLLSVAGLCDLDREPTI